jgi:penicillin-binding protein 1C
MLQEGSILPNSLVVDIPTQISGYTPKNFEKTYAGMIPAGEALAKSLNIPAVRMLKHYGLEKFYSKLRKLNFSTINYSPNHYGLTLILGGAEVTLWDLGNAYLEMAQTLLQKEQFLKAHYLKTKESEVEFNSDIFDPGALWWTAEALTTLTRPNQEEGWQNFESSTKVAWKTGTSFGLRDAWAVGMTPRHVVAVWAGNADGEGRPGLTGVSASAPILFKIFNSLAAGEWFDIPEDNLEGVEVCKQSGFLKSEFCEEFNLITIPKSFQDTPICSFHRIIHLDQEGKYQVNSDCYPVDKIKSESWFVLPPVQELFFKKRNYFYKKMPPFRPDCNSDDFNNMAIIYPKLNTKIFVPKGLDGERSKTIFEVAHRKSESKIYWHLNNEFIGTTQNDHQQELDPTPGIHKMTVVDDQGEELSWNFEVLGK